MIVTATEFKANFGKYLELIATEDIFITRNGKTVAKVCSITNNDILITFQKKAKDFGHCLVSTCAKSIHCDYIVTRNKRDFEGFGISALTPTEILKQIM